MTSDGAFVSHLNLVVSLWVPLTCVCVFAFNAINIFDWIRQWKHLRSVEVSPADKHFDHSCICCVAQIISASSWQSYCLRHCWITKKLVVYDFYLFMFMCVFSPVRHCDGDVTTRWRCQIWVPGGAAGRGPSLPSLTHPLSYLSEFLRR